MSRAFNKVCKLNKSKCIFDALLDLIVSFCLENCFQMVRTSEWLPVKAGVLQGPILHRLFYLIYVNEPSIDILSCSI